MKFKILIILFSVVIISSCTTTSKMYTVGTRNIDYSATYEKVDVTEAIGEFGMFLIFPFKFSDMFWMEVFDKALEKGGYDFMTDVTVERFFIFTYIYNYESYRIRGTGWRKKVKK